MSLHPSLGGAKKGKQHRSVLKRFERIAMLKKEGKWDDAKSIFGLPKIKIIKIKIKKEKAAPAEAATPEAETQAAAGTAAPGKPIEAAVKTAAAKTTTPAAKPQPKAK